VPTLCLVPTARRAGRLARRLCDAEGGLLFGPRVLTPEELVQGLLTAAGDARPLLSPLAERILVVEAGRAAGGPFAVLSPAGGLAHALTAAVSELRRGEVTAENVREAAEELQGRAAERMTLLAAVLAGYQARLAERDLLDRAAGTRAAQQALRLGVLSPQVAELELLVVEGFHALPPGSLDLLAELARRSRRGLFRLPYFPQRPDLSAPAEPLVRKVESWHEIAAQRELTIQFPQLEGRGRRMAEMLARVRGSGGASPAAIVDDGADGRILGVAAPDEDAELRTAARLAAELVDGGMAAEEIILLTPSASSVAARLERAFAAYGVPLGRGSGSPLREAPPVQIVRKALQSAPGLARADAEALAASTYLGSRAPPRFGRWLDRAGALDGRGDLERLLLDRATKLTAAGTAGERAALRQAAGWLHELTSMLRPLAVSEATARQRAAQLRGLIQVMGLRRQAARAADEVARRDSTALQRLEASADSLADSLELLGRGAERLRLEGWLPLLDLALDAMSLPPLAEPAAGAVELWPLSEAPGLEARAAIVLGCGRTWPSGAHFEPVLREPERVAVNRRLRRGALMTRGARRAEADYLALCAMAAGRETLAFTWSEESGGPALVVAEALTAAGVVPRTGGGSNRPAPARSANEALCTSARMARQDRGAATTTALAGLPGDLVERARSAIERGRIEAERQQSVLARRAGPWSGGLPGALLPLFQSALPEEWSPSRLETWAGCPYRLFANLGLGIPESRPEGVDIDPRSEGSLAHAVMERFLSRRRARGAWPLSGDERDKAEARQVAAELFGSFEAAGRVGDPAVWAARRNLVLSRLDRIVESEAADHDGLSPQLLEHRFGGSPDRPALVFRDGEEVVRLEGRIDRVDADAERLLVLDYKNSRDRSEYGARLGEDALGVTSFQMPAYLLAAAQALPGRSRHEAAYALLRAGQRSRPWSIAADDPFLAVEEGQRARVRSQGGRTFADAVLAAVRTIRRGEFPIVSRDCDGCPYGAVCRFQFTAEAEP
jgi:RecB family exonuclease